MDGKHKGRANKQNITRNILISDPSPLILHYYPIRCQSDLLWDTQSCLVYLSPSLWSVPSSVAGWATPLEPPLWGSPDEEDITPAVSMLPARISSSVKWSQIFEKVCIAVSNKKSEAKKSNLKQLSQTGQKLTFLGWDWVTSSRSTRYKLNTMCSIYHVLACIYILCSKMF